jgi:hypothetical protein
LKASLFHNADPQIKFVYYWRKKSLFILRGMETLFYPLGAGISVYPIGMETLFYPLGAGISVYPIGMGTVF